MGKRSDSRILTTDGQDVTEHAVHVLRLAVGSLDWGSGFWVDDDVYHARRLARAIGFDPDEVTPPSWTVSSGMVRVESDHVTQVDVQFTLPEMPVGFTGVCLCGWRGVARGHAQRFHPVTGAQIPDDGRDAAEEARADAKAHEAKMLALAKGDADGQA